jgi:ABC-2 type transport system permease protein
MEQLRTLVRTERTRLLHRPMAWILGIILGGLTGLIYLSLTLALLVPEGQGGISTSDTEQLRELLILPEGFGSGFAMINGFATIMLIILAAGIFGSEFSWGTVRTSLIAGVSRDRFYAGKIIALLTVGAAVTLMTAILAFGASLAAGLIVDGSLYTDEWLNTGFVVDAIFIVMRGYLGVAIWILIAATVTLLTRSLAAGIGLTLGLNIGGDVILSLLSTAGDAGRWVARLFPNAAVSALSAMNSADPPSYGWTDYAWITANLLIYATAAVAVAIITFRRMDIIAATD